MSAVAHTAIGASARIVTGGLLVGGIVDAVADSVALHRAERALANATLADRLATVRAAEQEALTVARDLAIELARTRRELADAQAALAQERAQTAMLAAALHQIAAAC